MAEKESKFVRLVRWLFQDHLLPYVALLSIAAAVFSHFAAEKWVEDFVVDRKPDQLIILREAHKWRHATLEASASFFEALFVAAFLALSVDPVLKSNFFRDGLRGMFRYVYGFYLPDEVQRFWEERIMKEEFIRREYWIHWHLMPQPGSADRIILRLHIHFKPHNFTGRPATFVHKAFATADAPNQVGRVESMYCKSPDPDESYNYPDDDELVKHKVPGGYAGGEVMLPPTAATEKMVICGARYISEGSAKFGTDRVSFTQLSSAVHVRVSVDEALKYLRLSIIPSDRPDSTPKPPEQRPDDLEFCREWKLKQLFIPNERLVLRWEQTTSTSGDAVRAG